MILYVVVGWTTTYKMARFKNPYFAKASFEDPYFTKGPSATSVSAAYSRARMWAKPVMSLSRRTATQTHKT